MKKPLKILMVAPLKREVAENVTASRPRLLFDLSKKLKERGHNISIIGTGDSYIKGVEIMPVIEKAFNKIEKDFENPFYAHTAFLAKQAKMLSKIASNFDIVHNHAYPEFLALLPYDFTKTPILTTIHMTVTEYMDEALSFFPKNLLIAPSKAIKQLAKKNKIYRVIHHGIDQNIFSFKEKKGDYLLWVGRLSQAKDKDGNFMDPKGIKWAIKLAEITNEKLILSGNVEDVKFFEKEVKPHLSDKIRWVGEISKEQPLSKKEVAELMQNARVFLMTTQLPEAFGLVVAEAMSCGTPVIAFSNGGVKEIIKDKETGFLVDQKDGIDGLLKALNSIETINPKNCRARIEKYFTLDKMAENYEKTYYKIIGK